MNFILLLAAELLSQCLVEFLTWSNLLCHIFCLQDVDILICYMVQSFGSQLWDTALSLQVMLASHDVVDDYHEII